MKGDWSFYERKHKKSHLHLLFCYVRTHVSAVWITHSMWVVCGWTSCFFISALMLTGQSRQSWPKQRSSAVHQPEIWTLAFFHNVRNFWQPLWMRLMSRMILGHKHTAVLLTPKSWRPLSWCLVSCSATSLSNRCPLPSVKLIYSNSSFLSRSRAV